MDKLPEDVTTQEILLKLPAKSLSNLRYVSNYLWSLISNPSFVQLHLHRSIAQPDNHFLLISSHQFVDEPYSDGICQLDYTKYVNNNYACKFTTRSSASASASAAAISTPREEIVEIYCPFETTEIQASCNGLLYLHRRMIQDLHPGYDEDDDDVDILNYIWNPCTQEYKELPPPPPILELLDTRGLGLEPRYNSSSGFCGFGYDPTNDEYKILHYENRLDLTTLTYQHCPEVTHVSSTIEFNLYTLGTNTWKRIADNPYKSFFFSELYKRIGLLVNGALHWIMCLSDPRSQGKIVSFDFEKEVFREVQKPHSEEQHTYTYYRESLQVLQECLCICQFHINLIDHTKIDIWMLQDYNVMDSWTKLFRLEIPAIRFCSDHFKLLRYCENGEIVMLANEKDVIVYNPITHKARCAKKLKSIVKSMTMRTTTTYYMDYTESLVSLNSGTYSHRAS